MQAVTLLGATGSIGVSTLDVIRRHPQRFTVFALTANTDVRRLFEQCQEFKPRYAVMADEMAAKQLLTQITLANLDCEVLSGTDALVQVASAPEVDSVMAAIVGAAGLLPCLAAAQAGKRVLLANKEALVMSGHLFMQAVKDNHAQLLPIDSEHNAIFQSMPPGYETGTKPVSVRRILLTASGGPFRDAEPDSLAQVTPEQAVAHPNWSMGRKISVDSATMMNKGLELIEACWLFDASPDDIEVVIHRQSVIHSMVDYTDGSVLAQMGNPDMRTPIAHAMAWPERIESGVEPLDMFSVGRLDFEAPDLNRFPCLRLAFEAARAGGTAGTILNAANEIAVEAFLDEKLGFMKIAEVIEATMHAIEFQDADTLDTILSVDAQAREIARNLIANMAVN